MLVGEVKILIFTVFGLTYHIVLTNDSLFVPSGQSLRSKCHSVKLIHGSYDQIDIPYVYKPLVMMNIFVNVLK